MAQLCGILVLLSALPAGAAAQADSTPPIAVTTLQSVYSELTETTALLRWAAPGDDGDQGRAASIELRYSRDDQQGPVTPEIFDGLRRRIDGPESWPALTTEAAGTRQEVRIANLATGAFYSFALKAVDEAGNASYSNWASFATLDQSPPATVTDLAAGAVADPAAPGFHTVTLTWTAPGNNGMAGRAAAYRLRYYFRPIARDEEWALAQPIFENSREQIPYPVDGGTRMTRTLYLLLESERTYHFALISDDGRNSSELTAPSPASTFTTSDATPPGDITDLSVKLINNETIHLEWTAPGDNGWGGRATRYDIRVLDGHPILSDADFALAGEIAGVAPPRPAGTREVLEFPNPRRINSYGIAIKVIDEVPLSSARSNSVLVFIDDGIHTTTSLAKRSGCASSAGGGSTLLPGLAAILMGLAAASRARKALAPLLLAGIAATALGVAVATINDLQAGSGTTNTITLTWTDPGCSSYSVMVSEHAIDESNLGTAWFASEADGGRPDTAPAGTPQTMLVSHQTGFNSRGDFVTIPLQEGTRYWFAIRFFMPDGEIGVSNIPSTTTTMPPIGHITDLRIQSWISETGAVLTWTPPAGAATYDLRYRIDQTIETPAAFDTAYQVDEGSAPAAGFPIIVLSDLAPDTNHRFVLKAANASGDTTYSNSIDVWTPDNVAPQAVSGFSGEADSVRPLITLRCTAPHEDGDQGYAARSYEIRYSTVAPVTAATWDDARLYYNTISDPLLPGRQQTIPLWWGWASTTLHHFAIRAIDNRGNAGPVSTSIPIMTGVYVVGPAPVTDLMAISDVEGITLAFTAPASNDNDRDQKVSEVDVRYSTEGSLFRSSVESPETIFSRWTPLSTPVAPDYPGMMITVRLSGLTEISNRWFAVRTKNAHGTWSYIVMDATAVPLPRLNPGETKVYQDDLGSNSQSHGCAGSAGAGSGFVGFAILLGIARSLLPRASSGTPSMRSGNRRGGPGRS